ncbi:Protein DENND6B [Camelus dromedarius]|uniref:Protein DENND6B n=1 Tax=Camelus dromedarius TaxID=9838 RepID=A0A5N4DGX5_CAMDR|nr:Protein DENND6B [Camelus dromedarius]
MDAGPGAAPHPARGRPGAPSSATRAPGAPWARFSAWLECVCVVTFDLELGQALELVYPSDSRLTDKEVGPALWERTSPGEQALTRFPVFQKSSICYLSFPDSHSGPGRHHSFQREPAHYFGYVYFRQVKDSSVKRGYFQKSLVLVSRLPFVRLFQALLSLIAPEYFDKLVPCLEAVCSEIDQWPDPMPGQTLNLPVMGVVLQVHIPSRADKPESSPPKQCGHENLLPAPVVLSSVHELDLFRCFQPVLAHVQMLWELMLLGEPLVVLAPSPAVSSEMVLALTSCLQPLKFCCDYRPYFTVHDSEFKEFTTRTQAPPNVVLGVTNPFFIKTLQHWPHILRIGEPRMSGLYTAYTAHLHRDKALLRRLLKGLQRERPSDLLSALLRRHLLELTQSFIIPLVRPGEGGHGGAGAEAQAYPPPPTGALHGKPHAPAEEHHALEGVPHRTEKWGHMEGLKVLLSGKGHPRICPRRAPGLTWPLSQTPPQIRPFRQDDFLRSLEHSGPQLTCMLKGDWLGLYRRFFKSPHFDGWYRQRHKEMAQKLEALHLEAICEANIEIWMKDKSEVEVVDLVLKLRERLVRAQGHQLPVKEATLKRARLYIEMVVRSLPTDLQVVLCSP